jgi:hypothetical protein
VTAALEAARGSSHQHNRQIVVEMRVAVADARAIHQQGAIEQRSIAFRRGPQLLDEMGELLHVVRVDLAEPVELPRIVLVMRGRMMRFRYSDFRIRTAADFTGNHEGADTRQIRLVRQRKQIHHQCRVLAEVARDTGRLVDDQHIPVALFLGLLDAPLDVPHRFEIFRELRAIARRKTKLEPRDLVGHGIEDAAVASQPRQPRGRVGAGRGPKQPLEQRAWIVFHGQRRRRRAPRDCVRIGARVRPVAGAKQLHRFERELEGRQLRLLPEVLGGDLIYGHPGLHIRRGGALDVHSGQEGGCAARMITAAFTWLRERTPARQPTQHDHLIFVRHQRLQRARQLERAPLARGHPVLHGHPVGHIENPQSPHRGSGGPTERRERRHHAVQERQRDCCAQPPQERPSRQVQFGDDHGRGVLRI